ncbi:hypothetical protein VP01_2115g1, partial [Puccinia sorghi]
VKNRTKVGGHIQHGESGLGGTFLWHIFQQSFNYFNTVLKTRLPLSGRPTIGLLLTFKNWHLECWKNTIKFSSTISCHPWPTLNTNTWTLVCWIPIFNPLTSTENYPILVDNGFNMIGGQFTFCDFQVYLDLNNVLGVTMCVFRSQDHTHQTLKSASPSDRYTRLGFSCQMSEKTSFRDESGD